MARLWLSPEDTIDPTGVYTEEAIETASLVLYKLTGEKYPGISTSTDAITSTASTDYLTNPALIGGKMYNISRNFGSGTRELDLRQKPVLSVQSVEVNGEILDPSTYSLRNNAYLVRKTPNLWVLSPTTEILVTYTHGAKPPRAGKVAATRLANEIILWYLGDARCSLPERITSVSRQGVSYTILTPQDFIGQGQTGIYSVDSFIAAVNPDKQRKKPAIFRAGTRVERIN
jgi:hypothetical protein